MTISTDSNWDDYYEKFRVPEFMIRSLWRHFEAAIRKQVGTPASKLVVAELGGADSCMYERFVKAFPVAEYHIFDNNALGLERFRAKAYQGTFLHNVDLLNAPAFKDIAADVIFSVGIIEHFAPADTDKLIEAHFDMAKSAGLVVMSFPTPTFAYWTYRRFLERMGLFPPLYERPMKFEEVRPILTRLGTPLECHKIWSTILTQLIASVRKS
jgi:hypothetical protein